MMLVGIWLGLYWALLSFFDHYIQSSCLQAYLGCTFIGNCIWAVLLLAIVFGLYFIVALQRGRRQMRNKTNKVACDDSTTLYIELYIELYVLPLLLLPAFFLSEGA